MLNFWAVSSPPGCNVGLLALNDEGSQLRPRQRPADGRPGHSGLRLTPDLFPDLMAAAISRRDLGQWAASCNIATARHNNDK